MKNKWLYITIAVTLSVAMLMVGAVSYFTDYAMEQIEAQGGVSLQLLADEGVSSVSQQGYAVEKDDIGWYEPKAKANLSAELKNGYSFDGWYQSESLVSDTLSFEYLVNEYSVLTLKTIPVVYNITYDANGGEMPVDADMDFTVEDSAELAIPAKDGYIFAGWYEDEDIWEDGPVTETSFDELEDKEYHAKWEPFPYNISYDLNGGEEIIANPTSYTIESESIILNAPSKYGYTFDGWTGSNGEIAEIVVSIENGSMGDKSYTANWTPIQHDVTVINSENGVLKVSCETAAVGEMVILLASANEGYTYNGTEVCYIDQNGENQSVKLESTALTVTMPNGDVTLTPRWAGNSYFVKYEANGGEGSMEASIHTYGMEENLPANLFTRDGYDFAGWADTADGDAKYSDESLVKNLTSTNGATITLYAKWEISKTETDETGFMQKEDDGEDGKDNPVDGKTVETPQEEKENG